MKRGRQAIGLAIALSGSLTLAAPRVLGAGPTAAEMTTAVKAYKLGHSGAALAQFRALSERHPGSPLLHYYMALCAQNLHQMAEARQEYEWVVANSRDASLKNMANRGLQGLGGYSKNYNGGGTASSTTPSTTATTASAAAGTASSAKPSEPAKKEPKVAKVIEFMTNTDRQSAVFGATFEDVRGQQKYKAITFTQLDATDPTNERSMNQWNVSGYPSLVYLDSKGKVLRTQSAIGMSGDSFTGTIDELNGAK